MRMTGATLVALTLASGTGCVSAQDKPHCAAHTPRPDRLDITCSLSASETPRRFRFKAHFSGSHDDTTASLAPTLDGVPLVCDEGSKTRLTGDEEGDVALACRFSVSAPVGTQKTLRVRLSWHHAQYTAFELAAD